MNKKIESALNEQINAEMYSSYMYLSMSAYFSDENLNGFANWMRVQAQEELFHAMKIFDYVNERGGRVELKPIEKPAREWKSALDVVKETLKHEKHVTSLINKLMDVSIAEKDHASVNFLQWFVAEQVEEEASVSDLLAQLEMSSENKGAIFMIDRELKTRTFNPPTN